MPGNHDLWVSRFDVVRDSLLLYDRELPLVSADHGFHFLDADPLLFPDDDLALADLLQVDAADAGTRTTANFHTMFRP